jgi:hypothetical protein
MKVVMLEWDNGRKMYSRPCFDDHAEYTAKEGKRLYEADQYSILDYVEPGDGGCWFCYTQSDDMLYEGEFDTGVHKECLEAELRAHPDHPEARLMSYLLEEES